MPHKATIANRWRAIFYDYPITPLEITIAWLWLVWGLQLLTTPTILDGGRVHQVTREIIAEWQLGIIYTGIGCVMLIGATIRHRTMRRFGAFCSAVSWMSQLLLAVAASGVGNLTVGLDVVMATGSLWMIWRWAGLRPQNLP